MKSHGTELRKLVDSQTLAGKCGRPVLRSPQAQPRLAVLRIMHCRLPKGDDVKFPIIDPLEEETIGVKLSLCRDLVGLASEKAWW